VTDVIVKVTADNGLVGWGESTRAADVFGILAAVRAMTPIVAGRSPWDREAIGRDIDVAGAWQFQEMTGNFAWAGIDMALWDLCGKEVGKPLYQLLGGAMRDEVNYFCYLPFGTTLENTREHCLEGVRKGYRVFYIKLGVDTTMEERMLAEIRGAIGAECKLRIDANQSWDPVTARRLINRWDKMFQIDFVEAPTQIAPLSISQDLKHQIQTPLCANEGMWRVEEAHRIIESRAVDYLCFSPYWVGSISSFMRLCHLADFHGLQVVKHSHGEFGLAAAAFQHLMLAIPNAAEGHQHTASNMQDDILKYPVPIANGPNWGLIDGPGIGVEVDQDKVLKYHTLFLEEGEYLTYGNRFPLK
jgi:glucarate dehydratase